jgi:hypothetical protein
MTKFFFNFPVFGRFNPDKIYPPHTPLIAQIMKQPRDVYVASCSSGASGRRAVAIR